jgi:hypothetical protein
MSQVTGNTAAFIEAQQYSKFIIDNLNDGLLPGQFYRDVSDFPAGTQLNIKVIGESTLQDVEEDKALNYQPIDTNTVTLAITDYVGDAWYVTDRLRQDGAQIEQLLAMRGQVATRAIQENFESKFLFATGITAQTAANKNAINGFDHRWVADSAANDSYKIGLKDFIDMKLSFDKANVPQAGRICLVDPVVEATLNSLAGATISMDRNPQFQQVLQDGFVREHKFMFNIFGWDIYTSNRLPVTTATEAITHNGVADTAPVGSVANIFMNVLDDATKPMMGCWRQMPKVESERNKDFQRDEFLTTCRYGFGRQRPESLGVVLTSASNY